MEAEELAQRSRAMRLIRVLAAALLMASFSKAAQGLDLFADQLPQSQTNTCQSYAVMLALAAKGDPSFPIANFSQLRAAETAFRKLAEQKPGGPYGHAALSAALVDYTGGKYRLTLEDYPDITAWMGRVRQLTVLRNTKDLLIAQLTGTNFPAILTSVLKFDSGQYADGHIITILGLAGSGLNSNTELLAFNSAVKGAGVINRCEPGTQPGDMRYTAGVKATNNFTLKTFAGGLRLLYQTAAH